MFIQKQQGLMLDRQFDAQHYWVALNILTVLSPIQTTQSSFPSNCPCLCLICPSSHPFSCKIVAAERQREHWKRDFLNLPEVLVSDHIRNSWKCSNSDSGEATSSLRAYGLDSAATSLPQTLKKYWWKGNAYLMLMTSILNWNDLLRFAWRFPVSLYTRNNTPTSYSSLWEPLSHFYVEKNSF